MSLRDIQTPSVAKYGVLSPACTIINLEDGHWVSEFDYQIVDAGIKVENQVIIGASPGNQQIVSIPAKALYRAYHPFNIQATIKVSTLGANEDELQSRIDNVMEIVTQKAVERELWEGGIAALLDAHPQEGLEGNRALATESAVDVTPTTGTAVHPDQGVALLEDAIARDTIGYEGTLHAPRIVAAGLDLQLYEECDLATTKLGSKVVAGVGYTRRGPDGELATGTNAWMYMTGPVTVILGKPEYSTVKLNQVVNTSNNEMSYFVDRPAAVVWTTSQLFAVLVDTNKFYV